MFFPGLRLVAVFVLVCFTTTSVAWSAPSLSMGQGGQHLEIPVVPLAEKIAIPSELGTIKEIYTPHPNSPIGFVPVIIHLEDAHGSMEAQFHQEEILRNLQEQYGLNTFFVEGGIGDFQPELLHFFKDSKLNDKLIDKLTETGIVGGVERFLSTEYGVRSTAKEKTAERRTPSAVRAYGVENAELYRRELELFREVYNGKAESDKFLGKMRQSLLAHSASSSHKELKTFFREWLFQEEFQKDILSHLSFLEKHARETLGLDLTDAREQYDWPQLVRFFKLQRLEKSENGVRRTAYGDEKQKLAKWLNDKKLTEPFSDLFQELEHRTPYALLRTNADFRTSVERFYEAASPKGFRFENYPNLSRQIGLRIFSSELQAPDLLVEVERLNERILQKLAVTSVEKNLVASYQNYFLLRKLLALELTRGEYEELSARPETQAPNLASKAMEFYKIAQQREQAIFKNMLAKMKETKQPNAVLITGGFHSEGLSKFFKDSGASYIRIAPRISGKVDDTNYLRLMTLGGSFSPAVSYARQPSPADLLLKTTMPNYFGLYRDEIRSISKDLLGRQPEVDASARSEAREAVSEEAQTLHLMDWKTENEPFFWLVSSGLIGFWLASFLPHTEFLRFPYSKRYFSVPLLPLEAVETRITQKESGEEERALRDASALEVYLPDFDRRVRVNWIGPKAILLEMRNTFESERLAMIPLDPENPVSVNMVLNRPDDLFFSTPIKKVPGTEILKFEIQAQSLRITSTRFNQGGMFFRKDNVRFFQLATRHLRSEARMGGGTDFSEIAEELQKIVDADAAGRLDAHNKFWKNHLPAVRNYLKAYLHRGYAPQGETAQILLLQAIAAFRKLKDKHAQAERRSPASHLPKETAQEKRAREAGLNSQYLKRIEEILGALKNPDLASKILGPARDGLPQFEKEPQVRLLDSFRQDGNFTASDRKDLDDIFSRFDRRLAASKSRSEMRGKEFDPKGAVTYEGKTYSFALLQNMLQSSNQDQLAFFVIRTMTIEKKKEFLNSIPPHLMILRHKVQDYIKATDAPMTERLSNRFLKGDDFRAKFQGVFQIGIGEKIEESPVAIKIDFIPMGRPTMEISWAGHRTSEAIEYDKVYMIARERVEGDVAAYDFFRAVDSSAMSSGEHFSFSLLKKGPITEIYVKDYGSRNGTVLSGMVFPGTVDYEGRSAKLEKIQKEIKAMLAATSDWMQKDRKEPVPGDTLAHYLEALRRVVDLYFRSAEFGELRDLRKKLIKDYFVSNIVGSANDRRDHALDIFKVFLEDDSGMIWLPALEIVTEYLPLAGKVDSFRHLFETLKEERLKQIPPGLRREIGKILAGIENVPSDQLNDFKVPDLTKTQKIELPPEVLERIRNRSEVREDDDEDEPEGFEKMSRRIRHTKRPSRENLYSNFFDRARQKMKEGDFSNAAILLRRVIRKEPRMVFAYILLGQASLNLGNMREALEVSETALSMIREGMEKKDSRSLSQAIGIYGVMMHAWIGLNDLDKAREVAKKARDLEPKNPEALRHLAALYLKTAQNANTREKREFFLDEAGKYAEMAIQYALGPQYQDRRTAIISDAQDTKVRISRVRNLLSVDFPESRSGSETGRSELRGGAEGEGSGTKAFRRIAVGFKKFIRDEKRVIRKGFTGINAILADLRQVASDKETAVKILSRTILYGFPVIVFMIYGFPFYLVWSKAHPFWTGILTTSLLSGALTQLFLQKYAKEPVARSLNYYRLFYKTVFVFSLLGAGLVAFYSGIGNYKGIDGMIPSTGLWPLFKLTLDQLVWSPFMMTLYQIFVNFFEDLYQSASARMNKQEQGSSQGSFRRPRLGKQVYQIMLINWPLWIPAHLANYFFLQGLPGVRLIFVNTVAVIFYTILAFKIKTTANEKSIAELLGVPLEMNKERSLSSGLEALKVWAATLEQKILSLEKLFRESLTAPVEKRQEILARIFSSVDEITLGAVIEAEKMPLSKHQKRAAKYVIERRLENFWTLIGPMNRESYARRYLDGTATKAEASPMLGELSQLIDELKMFQRFQDFKTLTATEGYGEHLPDWSRSLGEQATISPKEIDAEPRRSEAREGVPQKEIKKGVRSDFEASAKGKNKRGVNKWELFDAFKAQLAQLPLSVIAELRKTEDIGRWRAILMGGGIAITDAIAGKFLNSAIREFLEKNRPEIARKIDNRLRFGGQGRYLKAYLGDDFDYIVKMPNNFSGHETVRNVWIGGGFRIAQQRLKGYAVPTLVFDASDGKTKPFVYHADGVNRNKAELALVQPKVERLIDKIKILSRNNEESGIEEAKAIIEKFKKCLIGIFRRGVIDGDFGGELYNYGVDNKTGEVFMFDFGDLATGYDMEAEFFNRLYDLNMRIEDDLRDINKELWRYYHSQGRFVLEDFVDEEGNSLFGIDYGEKSPTRLMINSSGLKTDKSASENKAPSKDRAEFIMTFPLTEDEIREMFANHKVHEETKRSEVREQTILGEPSPAMLALQLGAIAPFTARDFEFKNLEKKVMALLAYKGKESAVVGMASEEAKAIHHFVYQAVREMAATAWNRKWKGHVLGIAGEISGIFQVVIQKHTALSYISLGRLRAFHQFVRDGSRKEFDAVSDKTVFEFKFHASLLKLYEQIVGLQGVNKTPHMQILVEKKAYQNIRNLVYFGEADQGYLVKALAVYLDKKQRPERNPTVEIEGAKNVSVKFSLVQLKSFLKDPAVLRQLQAEAKSYHHKLDLRKIELAEWIDLKEQQIRALPAKADGTKEKFDVILSVSNATPWDIKALQKALGTSEDFSSSVSRSEMPLSPVASRTSRDSLEARSEMRLDPGELSLPSVLVSDDGEEFEVSYRKGSREGERSIVLSYEEQPIGRVDFRIDFSIDAALLDYANDGQHRYVGIEVEPFFSKNYSGIGTALMGLAFRVAQREGVPEFFVLNSEADDFYRSLRMIEMREASFRFPLEVSEMEKNHLSLPPLKILSRSETRKTKETQPELQGLQSYGQREATDALRPFLPGYDDRAIKKMIEHPNELEKALFKNVKAIRDAVRFLGFKVIEEDGKLFIQDPVFAEKIQFRAYQVLLAAHAAGKNALIILPTGLGKTLVAVLVVGYLLKNHLQGKILLTTNSNLLAEQHSDTFGFIKKEEEIEFVEHYLQPGVVAKISSPDSDKKRPFLWQNAQVIVATNDLAVADPDIFNLEQVDYLIVDEAHRVGAVDEDRYAGTKLVEAYRKKNPSGKLLGLTASPRPKEELKGWERHLGLTDRDIFAASEEDPWIYPYEVKRNSETSRLEWKAQVPFIFILLRFLEKVFKETSAADILLDFQSVRDRIMDAWIAGDENEMLRALSGFLEEASRQTRHSQQLPLMKEQFGAGFELIRKARAELIPLMFGKEPQKDLDLEEWAALMERPVFKEPKFSELFLAVHAVFRTELFRKVVKDMERSVNEQKYRIYDLWDRKEQPRLFKVGSDISKLSNNAIAKLWQKVPDSFRENPEDMGAAYQEAIKNEDWSEKYRLDILVILNHLRYLRDSWVQYGPAKFMAVVQKKDDDKTAGWVKRTRSLLEHAGVLKAAEWFIKDGERFPKEERLLRLLRPVPGQPYAKTAVFVNDKKMARQITELIQKELGLRVAMLVGRGESGSEEGMTGKAQKKVQDSFNRGELDVLVGTDVMAEGLNLHGLKRVVGDTLSSRPIEKIQRDGRVSRFEEGWAIDILTPWDMKSYWTLQRRVEGIKNLVRVFQELNPYISFRSDMPAKQDGFNLSLRAETRSGQIVNFEGETFDTVWARWKNAEKQGVPREFWLQDPRQWKDNSESEYIRKLKTMTLPDLERELVSKFGAEDALGSAVIEPGYFLKDQEPLKAFLSFLSKGSLGEQPDNLQHHLDLPRNSWLREIAKEKPQYDRKLDQYEMFLREVCLRWSGPGNRSEMRSGSSMLSKTDLLELGGRLSHGEAEANSNLTDKIKMLAADEAAGQELLEELEGYLDFSAGEGEGPVLALAALSLAVELPDEMKTLSLARKAAGFLNYEGSYNPVIRETGSAFFKSIPEKRCFQPTEGRSEALASEVTDDAVRDYLAKIGKFPLLTPLGEVKLGVLKSLGDEKARESLIESNLRLVIPIAARYSTLPQASFMDLIMAGNTGAKGDQRSGLVRAVDLWEPQRGLKFSTYAAGWIREGISKYTWHNLRAFRIKSRVFVERVALFQKACKKANLNPRDWKISSKTIAAALSMDEKKVTELREIVRTETTASLQDPLGGDSDTTLEDVVGQSDKKDEGAEVREVLEFAMEKAFALVGKNQQMNGYARERDKAIVRARLLSRFQLEGGETKNELAKKYNISRQRIHQVETAYLEVVIAMIKKYNLTGENAADAAMSREFRAWKESAASALSGKTETGRTAAREITDEDILERFSKERVEWGFVTKAGKQKIMRELARIFQKTPDKLVKRDFIKRLPEYDGKVVQGLMLWAKRNYGKTTDEEAVDALITEMGFKDPQGESLQSQEIQILGQKDSGDSYSGTLSKLSISEEEPVLLSRSEARDADTEQVQFGKVRGDEETAELLRKQNYQAVTDRLILLDDRQETESLKEAIDTIIRLSSDENLKPCCVNHDHLNTLVEACRFRSSIKLLTAERVAAYLVAPEMGEMLKSVTSELVQKLIALDMASQESGEKSFYANLTALVPQEKLVESLKDWFTVFVEYRAHDYFWHETLNGTDRILSPEKGIVLRAFSKNHYFLFEGQRPMGFVFATASGQDREAHVFIDISDEKDVRHGLGRAIMQWIAGEIASHQPGEEASVTLYEPATDSSVAFMKKCLKEGIFSSLEIAYVQAENSRSFASAVQWMPFQSEASALPPAQGDGSFFIRGIVQPRSEAGVENKKFTKKWEALNAQGRLWDKEQLKKSQSMYGTSPEELPEAFGVSLLAALYRDPSFVARLEPLFVSLKETQAFKTGKIRFLSKFHNSVFSWKHSQPKPLPELMDRIKSEMNSKLSDFPSLEVKVEGIDVNPSNGKIFLDLGAPAPEYFDLLDKVRSEGVEWTRQDRLSVSLAVIQKELTPEEKKELTAWVREHSLFGQGEKVSIQTLSLVHHGDHQLKTILEEKTYSLLGAGDSRPRSEIRKESERISRMEKSFRIQNREGIHLRPAVAVSTLAQIIHRELGLDIFFQVEGVDEKTEPYSELAVQSLGLDKNDQVTITLEGKTGRRYDPAFFKKVFDVWGKLFADEDALEDALRGEKGLPHLEAVFSLKEEARISRAEARKQVVISLPEQFAGEGEALVLISPLKDKPYISVVRPIRIQRILRSIEDQIEAVFSDHPSRMFAPLLMLAGYAFPHHPVAEELSKLRAGIQRLLGYYGRSARVKNNTLAIPGEWLEVLDAQFSELAVIPVNPDQLQLKKRSESRGKADSGKKEILFRYQGKPGELRTGDLLMPDPERKEEKEMVLEARRDGSIRTRSIRTGIRKTHYSEQLADLALYAPAPSSEEDMTLVKPTHVPKHAPASTKTIRIRQEGGLFRIEGPKPGQSRLIQTSFDLASLFYELGIPLAEHDMNQQEALNHHRILNSTDHSVWYLDHMHSSGYVLNTANIFSPDGMARAFRLKGYKVITKTSSRTKPELPRSNLPTKRDGSVSTPARAEMRDFVVVNPKAEPNPKAIMFDLDGTLVNTLPVQEAAFGKMYYWINSASADEPSEEELQPGKKFLRDTMGQLSTHQIGSMIQESYQQGRDEAALRAVLNSLAQKYKIETANTGNLIAGFGQVYEQVVLAELEKTKVELLPGVRAFLESLRKAGIPVYIGTGTMTSVSRKIMGQLGVRDYFRGIYGANTEGVDAFPRGKADMLKKIKGELGLQNDNELLIFGDGEGDMEASKKGPSSVIAVGITGKDPSLADRLVPAGADFLISDFRDWKAFSENLNLIRTQAPVSFENAPSDSPMTAVQMDQEFEQRFPKDHEFILAMFGETVLKNAALRKFFYGLIHAEKHPLNEEHAQYLASLLRVEATGFEGDSYPMDYQFMRNGETVTETIQYPELEQEFLDWAVKMNISLEEFPFAYGLFIQKKEEEEKKQGANTKVHLRAGNRLGDSVFQEVRRNRILSEKQPLMHYKGNVESQDKLRWVQALKSSDVLSETPASAAIKLEDLRIGVRDPSLPSEKGVYDIYLFTTNAEFIRKASGVFHLRLPEVTPVGYAQIKVLDGIPTVSALQPRFFLPFSAEDSLRGYVEGSMMALGLLIETNAKEILKTRHPVSGIRFVTPAYFLSGLKSAQSTIQHYYFKIPKALGYSLKALPQPIMGDYQPINFVFEKQIDAKTLPTKTSQSKGQSPSRAETRVAVDTAEGVFRQSRVLAMGKTALNGMLASLMPQAYAMTANKIDYGPMFAALDTGYGTPVSVVFEKIPALSEPMTQALAQFLAANRFIKFYVVVPGAGAQELLKFKKDLEALILQKAKKAVSVHMVNDAALVPDLISKNSFDRALIYDTRAEGASGLQALEAGLKERKILDSTMRVYDLSEGAQRPAAFFATLHEFFNLKTVSPQIRSALEILSHNLGIQAMAQKLIEQAA